MVSSGRYSAFARRATLAFLIGALAPLGGCRSADDVTGSISGPSNALPTSDEALRADAEQLGKRYDDDPGGKAISIKYARTLRALGRYSQAVAVMQSAAVKAPKDMEVLGAYGKALADAGELQQAADVLSRSYTPEEPNWSSMSTQGSVCDQLGDHVQAQKFYHDALQLAPNRPEILSNLGLSYALSKQLPEAEQTLRQAAAQPAADRRVRDNLALVLALEGKFAEAQQVNERDMSPDAAAANVAAVRQMIAQSNSWREIQASDMKKRAKMKEKLTDPAAPVELGPQG
jgi:Flp pilus assembly protein TadD